MNSIYCGNNAMYPGLLSGLVKLGSRHSCLKKGIGTGLRLPMDIHYGNYYPIDKTRKYCGNKLLLPDNYDRFGSLNECLQTGVGIGKGIKSRKSNKKKSNKRKSNKKKSNKKKSNKKKFNKKKSNKRKSNRF